MDEILEMLADNGKAIDTKKIADFIKEKTGEITTLTEQIQGLEEQKTALTTEIETLTTKIEEQTEFLKKEVEEKTDLVAQLAAKTGEVEKAKEVITSRVTGLIEVCQNKKDADDFDASEMSLDELLNKQSDMEKTFEKLFKVERISTPAESSMAKGLSLRGSIEDYRV